MIRGKHIYLIKEQEREYSIYTKLNDLFCGKITWCAQWRCYVYSDQPSDIIMSKSCLDEAFKYAKANLSNAKN